MSQDLFRGAEGIAGGGSRTPDVPLGEHTFTISEIRMQQPVPGAHGAGLLVKGTVDGKECGFRIALGGMFPAYGINETKSLIAAARGVDGSDASIVSMICSARSCRAAASPLPPRAFVYSASVAIGVG